MISGLSMVGRKKKKGKGGEQRYDQISTVHFRVTYKLLAVLPIPDDFHQVAQISRRQTKNRVIFLGAAGRPATVSTEILIRTA